MTGPAHWTLSEAAAALAERRISARELLDACLAQIAAWQGVTNAFIDLRADQAIAQAAAADAEIARSGPRSPLHGIPMAHKDMFYRQGRISTCGSALRRGWIAPETATVLQRLDAAGAVDLGTLNMAEWAGGATGHNLWFGDACNPWQPTHATGGSSSGSGAAVAARMVFAALGSDTGGSIRIPASMCGVAGLKPGWDVVSRHGAMPRAWTLDAVGPLARTAADCALVQAVIADRPGPPPGAMRGAKIGVETTMLDAADPSLRPALDAALALLADLGAELRPIAVPHLEEIFDLGGIISGAEAASLHAEQMRDHPQGYAPDLFSRMQAGLVTPAVLYLQALRSRARLLAACRAQVFADCTALFCPTLPVPVPTRQASRTLSAADVGRVHGPLVRNTRPFNMLGLPALSLPCGFDPQGLPIGFQLIGDLGGEAAILGIGMGYERAANWHARAPVPA